jgi:CRP/FNR family transcriptional regulator, cyclic AMP receptor protein
MVTQSEQLLRNIYLFKDLTPKELEPINALVKNETYSHGDEVFAEGDTATSLYVIYYGSVKIQHSGKHEKISVSTLASGSHFGEMSCLDGEKRSATVTAAEKSEIYRIDFQDLRKVIDAHPAIGLKVYKALALFLCGRLRITTIDLTFAREKNLRHF